MALTPFSDFSLMDPFSDPFYDRSLDRDFRRMSNLMNRALGDIYGGSVTRPTGRSMEMETFRPLMDVIDTGTELKLKCDVPGVPKENLQARVENGNQLIIEGDVQKEDERREGRSLIRERTARRYYRSMTLPESVQSDKVTANFNHGVLELTFPKKTPEETSAKKITIS